MSQLSCHSDIVRRRMRSVKSGANTAFRKNLDRVLQFGLGMISSPSESRNRR